MNWVVLKVQNSNEKLGISLSWTWCDISEFWNVCFYMPSGREHCDPLTFRSEHCTAHKDVHTHTIVPVSPKGSGPVPSHVQAKDRLSIWGTGWWRVSLLVLFLPVSNDVHQVLVVQVPCYIWGEGSEHLLHLTNRKTDLRSVSRSVCIQTCDDESQWNVSAEDVHGSSRWRWSRLCFLDMHTQHDVTHKNDN